MSNMPVSPEEPGENRPVPPPAPQEPLYTGSTWMPEPEPEQPVAGEPAPEIPVEFANEPPADLFPGPGVPPASEPPAGEPAAQPEPPETPVVGDQQTAPEPPIPPTQPGFTPPPPPPPVPPAPPQPLSPQDERTWAMVSHLSVLVNVFTGFLGTVAALVIYLAFKDRSRYVAFHALQAFVFQLVVFIGSIAAIIVLWLLTTLLIPVIIGLLCIPFSILLTILLVMLPVVALVYGVIGAMQVSEGQDFRYYWLGDWVRRNMPNP